MADQIEKLQKAIKTTQNLRADVGNVFNKITQGVKNIDSSTSNDIDFMTSLRQAFFEINTSLGELDKIAQSVSPIGNLSVGNSAMLSVDFSLDKAPMYTKLIQSYKWINKVHEHSKFYAHSLVQTHNTRRPSGSSSLNASLGRKFRRAAITSHASPQQNVDSIIQGLSNAHPGMSIVPTRPFGSPVVLNITLGRTLKAVVILRGLLIEWVLVKGFNEQLQSEKGKVDVWTPSQYEVFKKVTDHANTAMLHYYHPVMPDVAINSFMKWLHSYHNLFSAPCLKCAKYLQDDLPPTWRDMRNLHPYHENCKP